jgi:hypothetical protein
LSLGYHSVEVRPRCPHERCAYSRGLTGGVFTTKATRDVLALSAHDDTCDHVSRETGLAQRGSNWPSPGNYWAPRAATLSLSSAVPVAPPSARLHQEADRGSMKAWHTIRQYSVRASSEKLVGVAIYRPGVGWWAAARIVRTRSCRPIVHIALQTYTGWCA